MTTLIPLTDKAEIKTAYEQLKSVMYANTQPVTTVIGYKGENFPAEVAWHGDIEMWNCFIPRLEGNEGSLRYWCAYGLDSPHENTMVSITAEINMPAEGCNRRIAAVFAKNQKEETFLVHSGKVGGGRKGIGKKSFRKFYRGDQQVKLLWPDDLETEHICIGKLDDKSLRIQVAHFIREASRFKKFAVEGVLPGDDENISTEDPKFTPEFSGKRKKYVLDGTVESISYHGQVVEALNKELETGGFETANDRRDLFIIKKNNMSVLFEIKTDLTTTSIYGSIGQLMYHSILHEPKPLKVLVVPGRPDSHTKIILHKLGIMTLEYFWQNNIPVFKGLEEMIRKAR